MHKLSFICSSDLTISQKIMINQIKHDFIGKKKTSNQFQMKIKSFDNLYPRTCISKFPAWFYNNIFVKSLSMSLYCKKIIFTLFKWHIWGWALVPQETTTQHTKNRPKPKTRSRYWSKPKTAYKTIICLKLFELRKFVKFFLKALLQLWKPPQRNDNFTLNV